VQLPYCAGHCQCLSLPLPTTCRHHPPSLHRHSQVTCNTPAFIRLSSCHGQHQACAHWLRDLDDREDLVKQALGQLQRGLSRGKLLLLVMESADKSNKLLTVSQSWHVGLITILRPCMLHSASCLCCPEEELDDTGW